MPEPGRESLPDQAFRLVRSHDVDSELHRLINARDVQDDGFAAATFHQWMAFGEEVRKFRMGARSFTGPGET
jgi:hypothetical protein